MNLRDNHTINNIQLVNFVNLTAEKQELVRAWRNHGKIREWMLSDRMISKQDHQKFIEGLKGDRRNYYWLVCDQYNSDLGVVYLNRFKEKGNSAYLGIYGNPNSPGNGRILMDCLKALAFDVLGLYCLKLEVIDSNDRALRFYENAGFQRTGITEKTLYRQGGLRRVIEMSFHSRVRK